MELYFKNNSSEKLEAKIDASVSIVESLKHFVREVAETCITARKIQTVYPEQSGGMHRMDNQTILP